MVSNLSVDHPRCPPSLDGKSMLMAWCLSGVRIVIHPDMGIVKVHNTVPCESHVISKQDVSYKLCVYNTSCEKPLTKHHPWTMVRRSEGLHLLDVVWVKWLFMGNSSDEGNTNTFSVQFFSHWCQDLLPLFSVRELSYWEFWLIKAFHNVMPIEQRTQIRSVTGEVWSVIFGMGFYIVDNVVCRGDVLPENFHWHSLTWNAICHFPSRVIKFHYKTTKRTSNQMSITPPTITAFSLGEHK
jgi:hypothetical protein